MFKFIFSRLNIYKYYRRSLQSKKSRWIVIVLTILYFIVPVDLLPEILLGPIGLIDDGLLLLVFVNELLSLIRNRDEKKIKTVDDK